MDDQSNLLFHITQIYKLLNNLAKEKKEIGEIRVLLDKINSIIFNEREPPLKPYVKEKKIKCISVFSLCIKRALNDTHKSVRI